MKAAHWRALSYLFDVLEVVSILLILTAHEILLMIAGLSAAFASLICACLSYHKEAIHRIKETFLCCPLCYTERSMIFEIPLLKAARALCSNCGAKWKIDYDIMAKLKAELITPSFGNKGLELLNVKYDIEAWRKYDLDRLRRMMVKKAKR